MAICGERVRAGRQHLVKLARSEGLDQRTASQILDEVTDCRGAVAGIR